RNLGFVERADLGNGGLLRVGQRPMLDACVRVALPQALHCQLVRGLEGFVFRHGTSRVPRACRAPQPRDVEFSGNLPVTGETRESECPPTSTTPRPSRPLVRGHFCLTGRWWWSRS